MDSTPGRACVAAWLLAATLCSIGCGPEPAEVIRKRSHDFSGYVLNGETSAALPFVDPEIIKKQGAMITEFQLRAVSLFAIELSSMLGKGTSLEIGEVTFNDNAESAVCRVYVVDAKGKQIGRPHEQTWVRRDNAWYFRPSTF